MASFDPGNRLISAIDVPSAVLARALIERLDGVPSFIKIGLELYVAEGPDLVRELTGRGHRVMLDLKLHDIPATVERAVRRVVGLGAEMVTVHIGGGRAMLEAAQRATDGKVRLLGVTMLTSMDDGSAAEVGVTGPVGEVVIRRAELARDCGLFGVVASPQEAAAIRAACPDLCIVTPGVRPSGADAGDQLRVATPGDARLAGADLLVVGRPIRDAKDPAAAARAIIAELGEAGA
ncbi:MAG: orotidine-5'-phosphate decarboxylase [Deltaproteobacteria bacterium]|nr:orotidine-5'-phosphate decarboxylase [Deltaproteobacteria bacterium]